MPWARYTLHALLKSLLFMKAAPEFFRSSLFSSLCCGVRLHASGILPKKRTKISNLLLLLQLASLLLEMHETYACAKSVKILPLLFWSFLAQKVPLVAVLLCACDCVWIHVRQICAWTLLVILVISVCLDATQVEFRFPNVPRCHFQAIGKHFVNCWDQMTMMSLQPSSP